MNATRSFTFASENAHAAFLTWLSAYEADHRFDSHARISFVRAFGIFARWTVASDKHNETIAYAALAYGATI